jgi:hypothetical protein
MKKIALIFSISATLSACGASAPAGPLSQEILNQVKDKCSITELNLIPGQSGAVPKVEFSGLALIGSGQDESQTAQNMMCVAQELEASGYKNETDYTLSAGGFMSEATEAQF